MNISPEGYDFVKINVSVFLGMFGKSAYDYWKVLQEIKRDKNFILDYLRKAKKVLRSF